MPAPPSSVDAAVTMGAVTVHAVRAAGRQTREKLYEDKNANSVAWNR